MVVKCNCLEIIVVANDISLDISIFENVFQGNILIFFMIVFF